MWAELEPGGVGGQVVSRAHIAVPVRARVPDTPVQQVQLGIVGAGEPGGAGAGFPAVPSPGIVAVFARSRDGVESPQAVAGLGIVGVHKTPDTGFAATGTHEDFTVDGQGRKRKGVSLAVVGHLNIPPDRP